MESLHFPSLISPAISAIYPEKPGFMRITGVLQGRLINATKPESVLVWGSASILGTLPRPGGEQLDAQNTVVHKAVENVQRVFLGVPNSVA